LGPGVHQGSIRRRCRILVVLQVFVLRVFVLRVMHDAGGRNLPPAPPTQVLLIKVRASVRCLRRGRGPITAADRHELVAGALRDTDRELQMATYKAGALQERE
jgi:hypothetical protein